MVEVGGVQTFREVKPDKAQALKPLEEAAEVFGAWQEWDKYHRVNAVFDAPKAKYSSALRAAILNECADVITAACNLIAVLGVEDFKPYMERCAERNRKRGRM